MCSEALHKCEAQLQKLTKEKNCPQLILNTKNTFEKMKTKWNYYEMHVKCYKIKMNLILSETKEWEKKTLETIEKLKYILCQQRLAKKFADRIDAIRKQSNRCVVCTSAQINIYVTPCGHASTCSTCMKRIMESSNKSCPICRRNIQQQMKCNLNTFKE